MAESIKYVYLDQLPECQLLFNRPLELGPKLVESALIIFNREGSLFQEGKLKELVRKDTKQFLLSQRMPLVEIVRKRYASRRCEVWEMHELSLEEAKLLEATDYRELSEPEDRRS